MFKASPAVLLKVQLSPVKLIKKARRVSKFIHARTGLTREQLLLETEAQIRAEITRLCQKILEINAEIEGLHLPSQGDTYAEVLTRFNNSWPYRKQQWVLQKQISLLKDKLD